MGQRRSLLRGVTAAVVTVSDACSRGRRRDESGAVLRRLWTARGGRCVAHVVVPDDKRKIAQQLCALCVGADVVLSTGGTGLGPRDVTPEATRSVIDKEIPGLSEAARAAGAEKTRFAYLSRGLCGICGRTLVINLPGSPEGARDSFLAIADLVPHALAMIRGEGHSA